MLLFQSLKINAMSLSPSLQEITLLLEYPNFDHSPLTSLRKYHDALILAILIGKTSDGAFVIRIPWPLPLEYLNQLNISFLDNSKWKCRFVFFCC